MGVNRSKFNNRSSGETSNKNTNFSGLESKSDKHKDSKSNLTNFNSFKVLKEHLKGTANSKQAENATNLQPSLKVNYLEPSVKLTPELVLRPSKDKTPMQDSAVHIVRSIPKQSWNDAISMFPELAKAKLNHNEIKKVSQALLINEICFYNYTDAIEDLFTNHVTDFTIKNILAKTPLFENKSDPYDLTLGFTQISRNGVIKDQKEFPQLQKFLEQNGYKKGDEKDVLQNINLAPFLIVANLAHNIKMYQKHNIPINIETLVYGYNPDVYSRKNDNKKLNLITHNEYKNTHEPTTNFEKMILPNNAIMKKSEHLTSTLNFYNLIKTKNL